MLNNMVMPTSKRHTVFIEMRRATKCGIRSMQILKYLVDTKLLLWIDTDAVFVDMNRTLESFIQSKETHLVFKGRLHNVPINAGVLLMRSNNVMQEFFRNVTAGKAWRKPD